MEIIYFSLNVPTSSVEDFELKVLKLFNVNGETCSLMLKNAPTRCIDNLGDEYYTYSFSTLNIVDIYLLGRYVAIFNI